MLRKLLALGLAVALPAATAGAAVADSAPAYVGRFGPPGFYTRFGKPSAYKPKQLHPFSADDGAYLYSLRWSHWGQGTSRAKGKVSANDCKPNCAMGHFHHYRGGRARSYRLRAGTCHDKPGRFYTRVRLHFPAKTHLNDFTVKLVTGCGTS